MPLRAEHLTEGWNSSGGSEYTPAMPKFTALHFLLGTGRPEDRAEAEQRIRTAFEESGGLFGKAAEHLQISDRQLRRYCHQLGIDLFREVDSKKAAAELEKIRRQLAQEQYEAAAAALGKILADTELTAEVLAAVHALNAEAHLFLAHEDEARDQLRMAFRARPEFELPSTTPAHLRKVYAEILEEIAEQLLARARRMRRSGGRASARS